MTITLDESLFGVKDFGKLTLSELTTLYNGILNVKFPLDPIDRLFERLYVYDGDKILYNIKKIEEMRARIQDTDHKYDVKIEIKIHKTYAPHIFDYYINTSIDDVLMGSLNLWETIQKYQTEGYIFYINEAHNKYLQTLYYAEFKQNMTRIKEDLIATAMHPRRLMRHLDLGGEIEDF